MSEHGKLRHVKLSGYKSIKHLDLDIGPLNVLIGPNGAGKSNFVSFFHFMNKIVDQELQLYVSRKGTAEAFLHFGSKETDRINAYLWFKPDGYGIELIPTNDGRLVFKEESIEHLGPDHKEPFKSTTIKEGDLESSLKERKRRNGIESCIIEYMHNWKIYHFHDTSATASVKKAHSIHDDMWLRPQGENLAAFLYSIQDEPEYKRIVQTIQRVAPFFQDFILIPDKNNEEQIRLRWKHKASDAYFDANSLSDGTLRFMCLATLLLQPTLPNMILLDEPELGFHPYALQLLAGMLKSVSGNAQVIVSTQSVTLANQFDWQDIIVVGQKDGRSHFRKLKEKDVKLWLDDYAIGDLWEKNLIEGTPE